MTPSEIVILLGTFIGTLVGTGFVTYRASVAKTSRTVRQSATLAAETSVGSLQEQVSALVDENRHFKERIDELEQDVASQKAAFDHAVAERDAIRQELELAKRVQSILAKEVEDLKKRLETGDAEKERVAVDLRLERRRVSELESESAALKRRIAELEKQVEALRAESAAKERILAMLIRAQNATVLDPPVDGGGHTE